jgi:hypothetical protein
MAKIRDRSLIIQEINRLRLGVSRIRYAGNYIYCNISIIAPDDNPSLRTLITRQTAEDQVEAGLSGTSGSSGTSGTSGTKGGTATSGTAGTSGSSGTSGTSAAEGTSGTSGSSGTSGVGLLFNLSTTGKTIVTGVSTPVSSVNVTFDSPRSDTDYVAIVSLATTSFWWPTTLPYISVSNKLTTGFTVNFTPALVNNYELNWLVQDYNVPPVGACSPNFPLTATDRMYLMFGFDAFNNMQNDYYKAGITLPFSPTWSLAYSHPFNNWARGLAAPFDTFIVYWGGSVNSPGGGISSGFVTNYNLTVDSQVTSYSSGRAKRDLIQQAGDNFQPLLNYCFTCGGANSGETVVYADCAKFNATVGDSALVSGTLSRARSRHSFKRAGSKFLAYGGSDVPFPNWLVNAELFDPFTEVFSNVSVPGGVSPTPKHGHQTFAIECELHHINGTGPLTTFADHLTYETLTGTWRNDMISFASARGGAANAPASEGAGWVFSGVDSSGNAYEITENYKKATNSWTTYGGIPVGGYYEFGSCAGRTS